MHKFLIIFVIATFSAQILNGQTPTPTVTPISPTSPTSPTTTAPEACDDPFRTCVEKLMKLCTDYKQQYYIVSDSYACVGFNNTYVYTFHGQLISVNRECDTLLQLEVMRQVAFDNQGQLGPSTHAF